MSWFPLEDPLRWMLHWNAKSVPWKQRWYTSIDRFQKKKKLSVQNSNSTGTCSKIQQMGLHGIWKFSTQQRKLLIEKTAYSKGKKF